VHWKKLDRKSIVASRQLELWEKCLSLKNREGHFIVTDPGSNPGRSTLHFGVCVVFQNQANIFVRISLIDKVIPCAGFTVFAVFASYFDLGKKSKRDWFGSVGIRLVGFFIQTGS
jgi:hypothetical protein